MGIENKVRGEDAFTVEGFNDRLMPCLKKSCSGSVVPTQNVNVGMCDQCMTRYGWATYYRAYSERHKRRKKNSVAYATRD